MAETSRGGVRTGIALAIFLLVSAAVAVGGSLATTAHVEGWFAEATKPPWTPPDALFGPVWSVLYVLIAVAAWLVWRTPSSSARSRALIVYAIQMVLNAAWTPLFFACYPALGAVALWLAAAVILALLMMIITMLGAYWEVARLATWLMLPYLAWVTFATALNIAIAILNS